MDGPISGHILPALSKLSGLKKKKAAHEIGRGAMGRTGEGEGRGGCIGSKHRVYLSSWLVFIVDLTDSREKRKH